MSVPAPDVRRRAARSLGRSSEVLYARARQILLACGVRGRVADVGCGHGALRAALDGIADEYIGVDALRFDGFPPDAAFVEADLDRDPLPIADRSIDAAVALETIEHLENPRRFMRELTRITRPGGAVLLSTPNQVSALSLATLVARGEFNAFQDADYPAHLTALLPCDLLRLARECGLEGIEIAWSHHGRIPMTARHFPGWLSRRFPRALSDNVLVVARVPS